MENFIPKGSYTKTSRNISSQLFAQSKKRNQAWIPSGFNLTGINEANIENLDGHLVNIAIQPLAEKQTSYVPNGSYKLTSKDERVILSAECQKRDQSWQYSTLDITNLDPSKTLSNIDGVLTVD